VLSVTKSSAVPDPALTELRPDPDQAIAIAAPPGPLRINAGAGSGKTTVMAHRVRTLVEHGYRPDQILGLTFSNKAAENLRRRIATQVGDGLDVTVTTYHGFGASIVRDYSLELGFTTPPTLIDRANSFGLLYGALNEITLETRKVGRIAYLVAAAIRLASQCADHLVSLDQVVSDCHRIDADNTFSPEAVRGALGRRDLARLAKVFADAKRAYSVIDFGDQIGLAVQALVEHPERAEEIRRRHPAVLLDEYQDTNFAQRRLLQLIYPPGSPVTVVGDDMQSIYAFRGAHLQNLLNFPQHFGADSADGAGSHVEATLVTNYRSGPEIVAVANAVAGNVANTLPKQLRAEVDAGPGHIEALVGADDTDEAERIAAWIEQKGKQAGPTNSWSETVVLGRKRKIFPAIAEAISARGIPVEIVGIGGLLLRPEIVDVMAWLELLTHDDPNIAVLRLLRSPLRNIGLNDLALISRHGSRLARARMPDVSHPRGSLLDSINDVDSVAHLSSEAWTRLKAFQADVAFIRARSSELALVDLVDVIVDIERLFDRVDDVGAENLLRFLDVAQQFVALDDSPGTTQLQAFTQYLSLVADSEDDPAEASATDVNAVRIMSIHQAKGLEYNNVVLAGLSGSGASRIFPDDRMAENGVTQNDVLPLWLRTDNDGFTDAPRTKTRVSEFKDHAMRQRKDEELRLLYVAITRARTNLLCTAAQWYPGAAKPQGVSDFYELLCALPNLVHEHLPRPDATAENPDIARRKRRVEMAVHSSDESLPAQTLAKRSRKSRQRENQTDFLAGFGAGVAETDQTSVGSPANMVPMLSATSMSSLQRCPQQFEWSVVNRLPRPQRPSARLGVGVHRQLQTMLGTETNVTTTQHFSLGNDEIGSDPTEYHDAPLPSEEIGVAVQRVTTSRWRAASTSILGVEVPFVLPVTTATSVTGRIDAVFALGNRVHIVDWKTGRQPHASDPGAHTQLELYGLVARDLWGIEPDRISMSYVYLRPDELIEDTTDWTATDATGATQRARSLVAQAAGPSYPAHSGPWCSSCDFQSVCPAAAIRDPRS
jgi:DNA helicase II / ATP-dependent DNA helicase PcrA